LKTVVVAMHVLDSMKSGGTNHDRTRRCI